MSALININRLGWFIKLEDVDQVFEVIASQNADNNLEDGKFDEHKHVAKQIVALLKIPSEKITRDMIERYAKMSTKELYIPFTLAEPEKIEQRIVAPLESAKRLACTGEFLASIAMSGLVGEMTAISVWEMRATERKNRGIKDGVLFPRGFDRVWQSQRINILCGLGHISSNDRDRFRKLADNRNKILHTLSDSLSREEIERIVIDCYSQATLLMKSIFRLEVENANSLKMDPHVLAYVSAKDN